MADIEFFDLFDFSDPSHVHIVQAVTRCDAKVQTKRLSDRINDFLKLLVSLQRSSCITIMARMDFDRVSSHLL